MASTEFSDFLLLWPWKLGEGHQNPISLRYVPIIYPWKFGKNPTTGSQDIVQKRKCHADTNANTDAKGIRTKNNIWGDIKICTLDYCNFVGHLNDCQSQISKLVIEKLS